MSFVRNFTTRKVIKIKIVPCANVKNQDKDSLGQKKKEEKRKKIALCEQQTSFISQS